MSDQKKNISWWWSAPALLIGAIFMSSMPDSDEETIHGPSDIAVPDVSISVLEDFSQIVKDPNPPHNSASLPLRDTYRQSIMMNDVSYNPVGRILIDGHNRCSGVIGTFENYTFTQHGVAVPTTAHCVLDDQLQDEENITFVANFVSATGQERVIRLSDPLIWHDGEYEQNGADGTEEHDKAILFFPRVSLPPEIQPVSVFVAENNQANSIREFFDLSVMAVDYSQNLRGLSAHEDCHILDNSISFLRTDCVVTNQGSGGPLLTEGEEGNLRLIGVASEHAIKAHDDGSQSAYAYFTHEDFEREPPPSFLRRLNP